MTTLDNRGLNAAIGGNILTDEQMRNHGFTDHNAKNWYYVERVGDGTTFNLTLPKDGGRLQIDVLDEDFGQPYDYQAYLKRNPKLEFAHGVKARVEAIMERMSEQGIITGYKKGMYI